MFVLLCEYCACVFDFVMRKWMVTVFVSLLLSFLLFYVLSYFHFLLDYLYTACTCVKSVKILSHPGLRINAIQWQPDMNS